MSRSSVLVVALVFSRIAAVCAQQPDLPPAVKEYAPFITYYYTNPQPEKAKQMLVDIIKEENLVHPWYKDRGFVFQLMAANLGDIGYGQEKMVRYYESKFAGAPDGGKKIIIRALQTCGDKATTEQVDKWLSDDANAGVKKELTALKAHLADPKRKRSRDIAPKNPPDLDYLWGDYFATGEYAPISRILDVFDLPNAPDNARLKQAARFTTQSNFQQHPKLVELIKKKLEERGEGSKAAVEEMLKNVR